MSTLKSFLAEQETARPDMKLWSVGDYYRAGFSPVVFAIGKFNPPHLGHHQVVTQLQALANKLEAKPLIFVVDTGKRSPESPLSGQRRVHYLQQMFPDMPFEITPNAYDAITSMITRELLPVGEVTGSDRSYKSEIGRLFSKQVSNSEEYVANPILRDEESVGRLGASSSKMRAAIINNDRQLFNQLTGLDHPEADALFNEVKLGMGL